MTLTARHWAPSSAQNTAYRKKWENVPLGAKTKCCAQNDAWVKNGTLPQQEKSQLSLGMELCFPSVHRIQMC